MASRADDIANATETNSLLAVHDPAVGDLDSGAEYTQALESFSRRTAVADGGGVRGGFAAALRRRVDGGIGMTYGGVATRWIRFHREMRIHEAFPDGYILFETLDDTAPTTMSESIHQPDDQANGRSDGTAGSNGSQAVQIVDIIHKLTQDQSTADREDSDGSQGLTSTSRSTAPFELGLCSCGIVPK